jgi:hypothetical protein
MKPAELAEARGDLVAFTAEMLASLPRRDQRRWGETYLRGLMLDGRRKSIEPMAARLADGDEQCLQQFVNQSPWEWEPVRERLATRLQEAIAPLAWIIDDTGFPKAGRYSVGVARQYSGTLGKVGNCQIGVSVSAASEAASAPLTWRLFLPDAWDEDAERRAKAHLPAGERHREKWRLALEMLDELREWGLSPPPVVADTGYGEITAFRAALEQRGLAYIVEVKAATSAYGEDVLPERPAWRGSGRPPQALWGTQTRSRRQLILMDQPAEEIAAPHTCRGRCVERRPSLWAVESDPTVRTSGVVVPNVRPQHNFEVSAPEDQQMVQALTAQRFHPALGEGVGLGSPDRSLDQPHALRGKHLIEGTAELRIPVVEQKPHVGKTPIDGEVAGLLSHPGRMRVRRHPKKLNSPRGKLDDE